MSLGLLITGSAAAAQDVAQESFVRLLQLDPKHRQGSVGGLLSTIAYRLALKERRRATRHTDLSGHDPPLADPSVLDLLLRSERDRHIAAAIRSLDGDHRDTLVLRFYGGHSYQEIAELMGVPLGTVKSRMFYAVKQCREVLREKGILE